MEIGATIGLNKGMRRGTAPGGHHGSLATDRVRDSINLVANSSQYGNFATLNGIAFPSEFSLAIKYRLTGPLPANPVATSLFCNTAAVVSEDLFTVRLIASVSALTYTIVVQYRKTATNIVLTTSLSFPIDQKEHELIYTEESLVQKLYLDKVELATSINQALTSGDRPAVFTNVEIGRDQRQAGRYINAAIGPVRLISRPLSKPEVRQKNLDVFPHLVKIKPKRTTNDLSGNGYDLTLNNGPSYTLLKNRN